MKIDIYAHEIQVDTDTCRNDECEHRGVIQNYADDLREVADRNKDYPFYEGVQLVLTCDRCE